jgi:predicted metal-dependent phosphoesterase TrpH
MNTTDLHMHSNFSTDGELAPSELVRVCKVNGLETISLTDHNSVKGLGEAIQTATAKGLTCIPGIEIDCAFEGIDLHLIGYQIDWKSADFFTLEKNFRDRVLDSFPAMIHNLEMAGISVDADEVIASAGGQLPSAELIAEVLLSNPVYHGNVLLKPYMKGGPRSDMPYINFYLDYFAQGKPAYVKVEFMHFDEAVSLLKANHGIPVVAHPGINLKGKEEVVDRLLDHGAEGLEVFNNYHDLDQIRYFADKALHRKVLATCGSDFHGKTKPLISPGSYKSIGSYHAFVNQSIRALMRN